MLEPEIFFYRIIIGVMMFVLIVGNGTVRSIRVDDCKLLMTKAEESRNLINGKGE